MVLKKEGSALILSIIVLSIILINLLNIFYIINRKVEKTTLYKQDLLNKEEKNLKEILIDFEEANSVKIINEKERFYSDISTKTSIFLEKSNYYNSTISTNAAYKPESISAITIRIRQNYNDTESIGDFRILSDAGILGEQELLYNKSIYFKGSEHIKAGNYEFVAKELISDSGDINLSNDDEVTIIRLSNINLNVK